VAIGAEQLLFAGGFDAKRVGGRGRPNSKKCISIAFASFHERLWGGLAFLDESGLRAAN
jgi:hypothetical protein